jgi:hypothetical protein
MKRRLLAALLVAAGLVALQPPIAGRAEASNLSISGPGQIITGQDAPFFIHLTASGQPIGGALIKIQTCAEHAELQLDSNGSGVFHMSRNTPAGSCGVTASYGGDAFNLYDPSTASTSINILPLPPTSIDLVVPPPTKTGQPINIAAMLKDQNGPRAGLPLRLTVGTLHSLDITTDGNGQIHFLVSRDIPAGSYPVTVTYHGDKLISLDASSATGTLVVLPLTFSVQSVPALPGFFITLDDQKIAADKNGLATVTVNAAGRHHLVTGLDSTSPDTKASFVQWSDNRFDTDRQVQIFQDTKLFAGFSVSYLTSVQFQDADGHPVDRALVTGVSITAPDGSTSELKAPYDPVWLSLPAPSRLALSGLGSFQPHFSVSSGRYQGTAVINRGDDILVPKAGGTWPIKLRLYSLTIHARHLLIASGGPPAVRVTSSTGHSLVVPLGSDGTAVVNDLPRDQYSVEVPASTYAPVTPVALSRSQPVEVMVIGPTDALVLVWGILVVLLLLWVVARRSRWLTPWRRR